MSYPRSESPTCESSSIWCCVLFHCLNLKTKTLQCFKTLWNTWWHSTTFKKTWLINNTLQEPQILLLEIGLWSCCYLEQNCKSLIQLKPCDWCHICCLSFVFNNFGDMLKVILMCCNKNVFVLPLLVTIQFMQYNTSGKGTNTSLSSGKWKVTA